MKAERISNKSSKRTSKTTRKTDLQIVSKFNREPHQKLEPKSQSQAFHKSALYSGDELVVAVGPAGTGKTYLNAYVAADMLMGHNYKEVILTRPNIETGKSFGALPGELDEKFEPYLEPFKAGMIARMGKGRFDNDWQKNIKPVPLQFMRGATYDGSIVLLDEAQNTDVEQMKMLLTRIGIDSKLFISGDVNQTDVRGTNGLAWLLRQMRHQQLPFDIIEYSWDDCVRSDFCKMMLQMIDRAVD